MSLFLSDVRKNMESLVELWEGGLQPFTSELSTGERPHLWKLWASPEQVVSHSKLCQSAMHHLHHQINFHSWTLTWYESNLCKRECWYLKPLCYLGSKTSELSDLPLSLICIQKYEFDFNFDVYFLGFSSLVLTNIQGIVDKHNKWTWWVRSLVLPEIQNHSVCQAKFSSKCCTYM